VTYDDIGNIIHRAAVAAVCLLVVFGFIAGAILTNLAWWLL